MKFTSFVHKKLCDLLNDRRIVVWYDGEGDFNTFIRSFNVQNTEVLLAEGSVLKTRRQADQIYGLMNESDKPADAGRCMVIYIPRQRGATDDEKMRDPFEVFACAGTAFGDTEDQKMESLARQAMPEKAEEITRLFREGRPDIGLLDGLEKVQRWPLLNEVFHTETPAQIIAAALCDLSKAKAVDETPGCLEELLRLFESAVAFKHGTDDKKWKSIRTKAAEYILFSEFLFDLKEAPPDALSAVPRSGGQGKSTIYEACERMRSDTGLRDEYIEMAIKAESALRLPAVMGCGFDPGDRDTFSFEERVLHARAVEKAVKEDLTGAISIIEGRRGSIWRSEPARLPVWTVLERAISLSETAKKVSFELQQKKVMKSLVVSYVSDGWADLDRSQRLFESALTTCPNEEVLIPLIDLCRTRYRETVSAVQDVFLSAVKVEGWPPDGVPRQTRTFDEHIAPVLERRERVVLFLVDSLRFEMGKDLGDALSVSGEVDVGYAAAVIPTVTDLGMAALMPGADGMLRLIEKERVLVPALGTRLLRTSTDRMKLLAETYGDRFFETTLDDLLGSPNRITSKVKNAELLVIRTQDPDLVAENLGPWRARRYLSDVIGDIAHAVGTVTSLGFNRVVIAADHGHVLLPEIPAGDVVQEPPGGWVGTKRRCRLGAGLAGGAGTITLKAGHVGIQGDVEDICLPIGFRVFSDGEGYFHGGMSLQEAVIPVIVFRSGGLSDAQVGKPHIDIRYRSDRFTSRVIGLKFHHHPDIFGMPARVTIEAYSGSGAKAKLVGKSADCEARDDKTGYVTLRGGKETPVPVLIDPDFDGPEVEIRVSDPQTRVVWAKKKLKNEILD